MNNDRLLLLLICGSYLFLPSIVSWSTSDLTLWYRPWLVWSIFIVAIAVFSLRTRKRS